MADVIMPQMGESIAEGTVTKWLKNLGDRIERDEPLFEISTDKVDAEIPSPVAGILREIRVPPGTTVPVNTVVGLIAEEGEAAAAEAEPTPEPAIPMPPPAAEPAPPPAAAAEPAPEPAIPLPPPPEPAAPAAAPSPTAPPLRPVPEPPATPAQQVLPYIPPVDYQLEDDRPAEPPVFDLEKPKAEMTPDELRQSRSSPVVRKIAAEHKVDLRQVPGTGIGGRVTKQDILGHIEGQAAPDTPKPAPPATPQLEPPPAPPTAPAPAAAATPPGPAAPSAPTAGRPRVEVVPMSPIRKRTAEHMVLSKRTSAHVSTVFEVDMTRVDHLRKSHGQAWEERARVKLTFMPFILKAVVDGLKAFPILNARVDGDKIAYHKAINLGVAVALEWGLIVPVIHDADEKNLLGLARAVKDLADRARAKKLKVDEVQGGTFTITNPGVFGSLFGTPIINQPQVAILDVGTIEKRPVVRHDAIAIRTMAYFSLTFDHRLVDGADADRFMAHLKTTLQEFDEAAV